MKIQIEIALRGEHLVLQNKTKVLEDVMLSGETSFVGYIEPKKPKRSNQQNRAFFGVLIPHMRKALYGVGYDLTDSEVHEWVKRQFLTVEKINHETGEVIEFSRGTSSLTRAEHANLYDRCQRFAAEFLNYNIPDPDPDWYKQK